MLNILPVLRPLSSEKTGMTKTLTMSSGLVWIRKTSGPPTDDVTWVAEGSDGESAEDLDGGVEEDKVIGDAVGPEVVDAISDDSKDEVGNAEDGGGAAMSESKNEGIF
mgnify:CR=1 FL=1